MIKLRYAQFTNFRGLRDVKIDFSTSDDKPLTVIRAANYTGKTTVLYGLTWALFGDPGLPISPRQRDQYRLHPIDWDEGVDGETVEIEVEVGLTVIDDQTGLHTNYILIRKGSEVIAGGNWRPQPTTFDLIHQGPNGDAPVRDADRVMDLVLLPLAKKDIFFVDGDARVKDYVKDEDTESRSNVEGAVRHLLALDIVEAANAHMDDVLRDKVNRVRKEAAGTQLASIADQFAKANEDLVSARAEKADVDEDLKVAVANREAADSLRVNALVAGGGDAEKLQADLTKAEAAKKEALARVSQAAGVMRKFVNAHELYELLALDSIKRADVLYETLRKERKIPNVMPSMLRERLALKECICGADLSPGTPAFEHLTHELEAVQRHDQSRAVLGDLADSARSAMHSGIWKSGGRSAFRAWVEAVKAVDAETNNIANLEHQVKQRASAHEDLKIADGNLRLARDAEEHNKKKSLRLAMKVEGLEGELKALGSEMDKLTKKAGTFALLLAEQQAATDIKAVLNRAVDVLLGQTIDEVSDRMNELFMSMIATSPEAASEMGVVTRVVLTHDCDIKVYGPSDRELKPRTDISGAQQQALTVALIMALIEVSGDASPTVIDTPLGMTSGEVRTHFLAETLGLDSLRQRGTESTEITPQKVLLMTPNEILGVEEILEATAGRCWTLSNSQHFPGQLRNDPGTKYREVLVCECGPRLSDHCHVCARSDWM